MPPAKIAYFPFPLEFDGRTVHVHGTSAQVELESTPGTSVAYRGWGLDVATFRQRVWFHVSLPVSIDWTARIFEPTEVDDLATLAEVGAEYAYADVMEVVAVHLWDGGTRFAHWDNTGPGPKPTALKIGGSGFTWSVIHKVKRSVGLSFAVQFPVPIDAPVGQPNAFTLNSAHATFE